MKTKDKLFSLLYNLYKYYNGEKQRIFLCFKEAKKKKKVSNLYYNKMEQNWLFNLFAIGFVCCCFVIVKWLIDNWLKLLNSYKFDLRQKKKQKKKNDVICRYCFFIFFFCLFVLFLFLAYKIQSLFFFLG